MSKGLLMSTPCAHSYLKNYYSLFDDLSCVVVGVEKLFLCRLLKLLVTAFTFSRRITRKKMHNEQSFSRVWTYNLLE